MAAAALGRCSGRLPSLVAKPLVSCSLAYMLSTIAWSKAGTIASITPDGCSLELRVLRINPSDGSWGLCPPQRCDLVSGTPATPLVHLAWYSSAQVTSTGQASELAVIDAGGRLAILAFPFALNKCFLARKLDADPINHLHAVVGCYWLPIQPPTGRPVRRHHIPHHISGFPTLFSY